MGDPLMVALFWVAFLPSTIRWQQLVAAECAESEQLLAWRSWSGARIDLSLSQYADDTTEQIEAVRTMTNKEVLRFRRLVPCDVEARVRRLEWAQTLVQNPAHNVRLVAASSGDYRRSSSQRLD